MFKFLKPTIKLIVPTPAPISANNNFFLLIFFIYPFTKDAKKTESKPNR